MSHICLFVCDLIRLLSCRETKLEAATLVHLRRQEARELEDDKRRLTQALTSKRGQRGLMPIKPRTPDNNPLASRGTKCISTGPTRSLATTLGSTRGTGFYSLCESSDLPLLARLNGAPTLVALKIENFQLVSAPNERWLVRLVVGP